MSASVATSNNNDPGRGVQRARLGVLLATCAAFGALQSSAHSGDAAGVAALHPELWPPAVQRGGDSTDIEPALAKLLAGMSLEEKVGQMIQADIASITPEQLQRYKLGSILAGGGAAPGNDVRTPPQAWLALTNAFFEASLRTGTASHEAIPIIFGIDAVHGNAKIVGATVFPHNVGLGAAHDAQLVRRIGEATAEEVAAIGIDWTFAPTVAVARDPRWGRSYESYAESPQLVAQYASAVVTGLQGEWATPQFMSGFHTLASVKHFLGDGGTKDGRDQGQNDASEALLSRIHGAGYPAAIRAGAMIVMASYNSWHGTKMHASHYLLTDILKKRMGFDGFVVSDWNAHEQVPGCTKFDCPAAYLAGVDMLMAPDSWQQLFEHTLAEAQSGVIPTARIDDAVRRILRVKLRGGIFQRAPPLRRPGSGNLAVLGDAEHRALARESVRKSLVLLKNEHDLLPLKAGSHVLVAGEAADDIGMQCGGWTIDWQGDHNLNTDFPGGTSIYAGIAAAVGAAGGSAELSREGRFSRRPDAAIVVFGEGPYAEFEGDRETLEFSPADKRALRLLQRLRAQHIPVVSVFLSGRPLWVNPELNASEAFVAAWLPGSEGGGIADVLFRSADGAVRNDFTGRLAFSWPRTAMPVRFSEPEAAASGALFAPGYGLHYGQGAHVARLSENPQIPAERRLRGTLYHAAHVTAPWSIYLADGSAEVRLTTARQESPGGGLSVARTTLGDTATWNGTVPSWLTITGRQSDWEPQSSGGASIELRYRIDERPSASVRIGLRCLPAYQRHATAADTASAGGTGQMAPEDALAGADAPARCGLERSAMLDLTSAFQAARVGAWRTLLYSLACFRQRGADLSNLAAPFAIEADGRLSMTVAEVRIVYHRGASHCPGG